MSTPELRPFRPEDVDWLVERHGTLYACEAGFDQTFAPLVRMILEAFVDDHDPERERGWIAHQNGQPLGSVFCVRRTDDTAQLRLFLLVPEARGKGLGRRMLQTCMQFAREAGYSGMLLMTHESHKAACALYRAAGWQLASSEAVLSYGVDLVEQCWTIRL